MKKIFLVLILCFFAASSGYAQTNTQAMRSVMVFTLMQYGQKLYERGNFDEASAVFNHVLTYDNHQPQALQYLKDMGYAPAVDNAGSDAKIAANVDVFDTNSLKAAIEAKKRSIERLRAQIKQLRENLNEKD